MKNLFIDCSYGISGDMLLAGLIDMGVPLGVVEESLNKICILERLSIKIEESKSSGFRGLKSSIRLVGEDKDYRTWIEIKDLIIKSKLEENLKEKVLSTFKILAESEASVHGINIDKVHFHELGSIKSIANVVGVCSALEYIKPKNIFCTIPPSGSGYVKTSHGELYAPVPVVVELAKNHKVYLSGTKDETLGELTTPSGLALLIIWADYFSQPESFLVESIGVGLGQRTLKKPNLLRILLIKDGNKFEFNKNITGSIKSSVISQEAWIDDSSAEDIAFLMNQLKKQGAIEVVSQPLNMKKGRVGMSITALVKPEDAETLRLVWFSHSSTIGIRERIEDRWLLPRRVGSCATSFGKVLVKQVKRPDGKYSFKPEFDELARISATSGLSVDKIRNLISQEFDEFCTDEDWRC